MNHFETQMWREGLRKAQADAERAEVELETARVIQQRERLTTEAFIKSIERLTK